MGGKKSYPKSAQVERRGVALCASIVAEMGHIWRELEVDVGIDGMIEIVEPGSSAATSRVLFVQSKATAGSLVGESETRFRFKCRPNDVEYWMAASNPVLLVVSHVERGEAWFKNLHHWFGQSDRRSSGIVEFDKETDRFEVNAAQRLLDIAAPPESGTYLQPVPKAESLVSNLLPVTVPDVIYAAPSSAMGWKAINQRLRSKRRPLIDDIAWSDGLLYSFQSFDVTDRRCLADDSQETLSTAELSHSIEGAAVLLRLLYHTLRHDLRTRLRWNQDRRHFHIPATPKLGDRVLKVGPTGSGRTVFKGYESKKEPTQISHYRHYAVELRFVELDDWWHLAVTPTYFFSRDGFRESRFADDLLSGIKRIEGHEAIRQQTVFWAQFLVGEDNLFDDAGGVLRFDALAHVDVDHGIDDGHWKPRVTDTLPDDDPQLALDVES